MKKIIIGSRGSDLALWQANYTQSLLNDLGVESEIKIIVTKGDRIQDLSFDKIEGKGFFTKEIEESLLNNEIDLAVHSHKDLETTNPEGLTISGVSYRENPSDVLFVHPDAKDENELFGLKKNAVVGTSSARRKAMIKSLRPDVTLKDLRGNVPTRLDKLKEGQYDAIILANAGVSRLEISTKDLGVQVLNPTEFIPAPAQGVLGWQTRENDTETNEIIEKLNNAKVAESIHIERSVLRLLEGGCQMPLGVFTVKNGEEFETHVGYATASDAPMLKFKETGTDAEAMIELIVNKLKNETVHQS